MMTARSSRVLRTIPLILILLAWPFSRAGAQPPAEWQGPAGWWSGDIGTEGGSAVQMGDTFEITGDGHDIWGTADGFHFMFKELIGDGSITARVVSNGTGNDTWAKGGVMIRDDLSPGSAHAMTVVTGGAGGGAAFQWRMRPDRTSGSAHDPTPNVSPPYWVRIEKTRRYFSSYLSSDGRTWRQQGVTKTLAVNDPVYIGLCVTSGDVGSLRTYTFDNVSYEGRVGNRPLSLAASQPSPTDGAVWTNTWANLSWTPGDLATSHNVYFSSDQNAVMQRKSSALVATTTSPSTSVGLPGGPSPHDLQIGTTYYWCVDAINDTRSDSPWPGDMWSLRIPAGPAVYLLITNEELAPAFRPLVERRTDQGFAGRLLTVEYICASYLGADKLEQIRNCIIDHYTRYGTQYVALGGDDEIVPVRYCYPRYREEEVPTDLYYSDLDGWNWDANGNGIYGEAGEVTEIELTPEVHLGRIPMRTAEQATAYINKVVTYETASPDGFANSMLCFGDWGLLSGDSRPADIRYHDPVDAAENCLLHRYLNIIQPHWQAVPFHVFCDTYSPWDKEICGDYDLTPAHLNERLQQGYHIVFYWGHGYYDAWGIGGRFNQSLAASLTNPIPSIVFSMACAVAGFDATGKFEPCLSEAFLRDPDGGAVVFFGTTRVGKGGNLDNTLTAIFAEGRTCVGEAMTEALSAQAGPRAADPFRQYLYTLQGDPCIHLLGDESGRRLQIFQPKACEIMQRGSDLAVRWNAAGMGYSHDEKVKIEYSDNSGHDWRLIPGAEALPYNGRVFTWIACPLPAGPNYRLRVTSLVDPSASDVMDGDFTINELGLLMIQSNPVKGVMVDISGEKTDQSSIFTNSNISIPNGATVSLSAPAVPGSEPDFAFERWMEPAAGTTLANTPKCTFIFTQDTTVTAEYVHQGRFTRHYYVNDEIPESDIAAGNDQNDGLSPQRPMRHIQAVLEKYPELGWGDIINVSPGVYYENVVLDANHTGLTLSGAGQDTCVIDGGANGSCIWLQDVASGVIRGFTIRNGVADAGGGIFCGNSSPTIKACMLANNLALDKGGGLYSSRYSSPQALQCRFIDNSARHGGAVYNRYCEMGLANCIFTGNSADHGAALFNGESTVTIRNCTFSQNVARGTGGGIANFWDSATRVSNCILWGDKGAEIHLADGSVTVTYSDVQGGWPGEGNIDADPLFADPDNDDYHLKSQAGRWERENHLRWVEDNVTSPCIDAGDPLSPAGDEPEPNGRRINMGAYGGTAEASKSP
ncbi:MAG: C25 family cysteine peptidase [Planctomycetota bacterium]